MGTTSWSPFFFLFAILFVCFGVFPVHAPLYGPYIGLWGKQDALWDQGSQRLRAWGPGCAEALAWAVELTPPSSEGLRIRLACTRDYQPASYLWLCLPRTWRPSQKERILPAVCGLPLPSVVHFPPWDIWWRRRSQCRNTCKKAVKLSAVFVTRFQTRALSRPKMSGQRGRVESRRNAESQKQCILPV